MRVTAQIEVTRHPKDKYYKDEGGRKNCLEMWARLNDVCIDSEPILSDNPIIKYPLLVELVIFYESGQIVEERDQNILMAVGQTHLNFDGSERQIKFRINKVSRRFDCRRFKIRISPSTKATSNTDYDFGGIEPAFSSAVEVFSKRKQHVLDGGSKTKRSKHATKQDLERLEAKLQARVMQLRDLVEMNQRKINSLISKANEHIDETVESRSLDHLTRAVELRNNGLSPAPLHSPPVAHSPAHSSPIPPAWIKNLHDRRQ